MAEEFFQQLINCIAKEGRRAPGHTVTAEVYQELMRDAERPAMPAVPAEAPPPRPELPPRPVFRPQGQGGFPPPRPQQQMPPGPQAAPPAPTLPGAAPSPAASAGSLDELRQLALACRNCPLAQGRHTVVFGEGNPEARLMFIGEGPGYQEDMQGRPFVGPAGQLLTKMIQAMQFTREEVYIANIVKCRPPNSRNPEPDEAFACIGYLKRQIELVQPEAIVLLGAVAVRFLLERPGGIMRLRGKWLGYNGIPVMPTFHPSYLLRDPSGKKLAWADLQMVMKMFGKVYQPSPRR